MLHTASTQECVTLVDRLVCIFIWLVFVSSSPSPMSLFLLGPPFVVRITTSWFARSPVTGEGYLCSAEPAKFEL